MRGSIKFDVRATVNSIVLIFLFLASLNTINRYYYFIFIAFGLFLIRPGLRLRFDSSIVPLLVLAVFWAVFSPITFDSIFGPLKPFTYMLCYLMGFAFPDDNKKSLDGNISFTSFYWFIGIIAAGPFVHYILNWIKNGNTENRNTIDFWSNSVMSATGQAALACLPLALAVACLFMKSKMGLKVMALISLVAIVMYNFVLAGRTLIVLLGIAVGVALIHRLICLKKGKIRLILLVLLVVLLVTLAYLSNFGGIKDYIESSSFYDRFFGEYSMDLDETGRWENKLYYLKNMLAYPFGGAHIRDQVGHAHDIYLDTYDEAGLFAFLAIVVYIILSIVRMIKCIRNKTLPFQFRQIVLCIYIVVYAEFMVEPILQGMPWLFASFCLMDGYVGRIVAAHKKYQGKENL